MQSISRIYLTGFMGSGKSTLGVGLAETLGYEFIDLDAEIEETVGMSVQQIFEMEGERAFRELETLALKKTYDREQVVVAVGGGALASEDRMNEALRNGLLVYLSAREETLKERLSASGTRRPLLSAGLQISELLKKRDPVYRKAHIVLPVDGLSVNEAGHALHTAINRYKAGD